MTTRIADREGTRVSKRVVSSFAVVAMVLAVPVAAAEGRGPKRAAGGEVHPVKKVYSLKQEIDIAWSGFATGEVWFWMEPAGTPLTGQAHGSYHSDYDDAGHYALRNPGPGRWEVHWSVLGEKGVYDGGRFRVRPPKGVKRARSGHYGCYTTTTMGLTRSSMQSIDVRAHNRYRAMGRTGRYRYSRSTATMRFTSGPLRKRVAQYRPDKKPTTIIFYRVANEVHGKPTIDVSDTYCYRGTK